ncbi:hypothetical protein [Devosia sp. XK-2]|uniref:hypothetical protein n=1 Tax=Devosia sp. XK-2 TaxID=3126689 RepID=UPI0030D54C42
MIPVQHAIEIALLVLVAYLGGCMLGYAAHGAVRRYAARPRLAIVPAPAAPQATEAPLQRPPANRSAARRLASAVERAQAELTPAAAPAQIRPPDLPAPRRGRADNLRAIKGIGQKTESALHDLGIYHYDQIAAWTPAHIDWLEGRIALKGRIRREQWVEQAVLLATAIA